MGITPLAMGKEGLIVESLGSLRLLELVFPRCWPGLFRSAVKERYAMEGLRRQTSGVKCRKVRARSTKSQQLTGPWGRLRQICASRVSGYLDFVQELIAIGSTLYLRPCTPG